MKIFAIRDRLIDYYLTPFAAESEKQVLATISRIINDENTQDAIAQAPHHYEVWQLGIVQEDGHITAERELLADCASLIRRDLRAFPERGTAESGQPNPRGGRAPGGARADTAADKRPDAGEVRPNEEPTQKAYPAAPGVPRDS